MLHPCPSTDVFLFSFLSHLPTFLKRKLAPWMPPGWIPGPSHRSQSHPLCTSLPVNMEERVEGGSSFQSAGPMKAKTRVLAMKVLARVTEKDHADKRAQRTKRRQHATPCVLYCTWQ